MASRHPQSGRDFVATEPVRTIDVTLLGEIADVARFEGPNRARSPISPTSAEGAGGGGERASGEPAVGEPEPDDVVEDPLVGRGSTERGVHEPGPSADPRRGGRVPQVPAESPAHRPPV